MLETVTNIFKKTPDFCSSDFKKVWTGFVDSFFDSVHARGPAVAAPELPPETSPLPFQLPAAARLVAIGDIHGDLDKARRAFKLGKLIDEHDKWVGGNTVAVQVGDVLDRGDQEIQLLYWLEGIAKQAAAAGGALHVMNGNHEVLNVAAQFRYATTGGFTDFQRWHLAEKVSATLKARCSCAYDEAILASPSSWYSHAPGDAQLMGQARKTALQPGGAFTQRFLARFPVILQVGSTLFVHGGVLPQHVEYGLQRMNKETQDWMLGKSGPKIPPFLGGRSAVVWTRAYSHEKAEKCDCDTLKTALDLIPGADRMVVGHTIQGSGINSVCEDRVYRVDVGMSKGCGGGEPEVLEILNDNEVKRLRESDDSPPLTSFKRILQEAMRVT